MRRTAILAVLILCAGLVAGAPPARPEGAGPIKADLSRVRPKWARGEVLVRFRTGVSRDQARALYRAAGGSVERRIRGLRLDVVRLPRRESTLEGVARLSSDPRVELVEPNLFRLPLETIPNDPSFGQQWGLRNAGQFHPVSDGSPAAGLPGADLGVAEAWDTEQGDPATVIAILDSGVDVTHPDIAPNLWVNPGEVPGNGVDDDANGYVDDVNGWDFAEDDATLLETDQSVSGFDHGTHVAGIAAAATDNATGVAGVCPGCRIMVLKFMEPLEVDGDPSTPPEMAGDLAAEVEAIRYAIEKGARIVNGSFGHPILWSAFERDAFRQAGEAGVLSVLGAGNGNGDNDQLVVMDFDGDGISDSVSPVYPASYDLPSILAVAATNHLDQLGYATGCAAFLRTPEWPCTFSNWGHDAVDVAAPGVDVLSTVPGAAYDVFTGTSMAAPAVAGVAGLVWSHNPEDTPQQVKARILAAADRPAGLRQLWAFPRPLRGIPNPPLPGKFVGSGRVNAARALTAPANPSVPGDGNVAGAVRLRSSISSQVQWPADTNDVYRKRLRAGSRYRVTLDGPSGRDLDMVVWRPGTQDVWQLQVGCFPGGPGGCSLLRMSAGRTAEEALSFTVRRTGVYYVQVAAWLFNGGRYTLRITRTKRAPLPRSALN